MKTINIYINIVLGFSIIFLFACDEQITNMQSNETSTLNAASRALLNIDTWGTANQITSIQTQTSTWGDLMFGINLGIDSVGNKLAYWELLGYGQNIYGYDFSSSQFSTVKIEYPMAPNDKLDHFSINPKTGDAFINWNFGDKYLVSIYSQNSGWSLPLRIDEDTVQAKSPVRTQTQRTWINSKGELVMIWITQRKNMQRQLSMRKISKSAGMSPIQSLELPVVDYYIELLTPNVIERKNGDVIVVWKEQAPYGNSQVIGDEKFSLNYTIISNDLNNSPALLSVMPDKISGSGDITLTIDPVTDKVMLLYTNSNAYYYRELLSENTVWDSEKLVVRDDSPNYYEAKVAINETGNAVIVSRQSTDNLDPSQSNFNNFYLYQPVSGWGLLSSLEGNYYIEDIAINNKKDIVLIWRDVAINGKSLYSTTYNFKGSWEPVLLVTTVDQSLQLFNISNLAINDEGLSDIMWASKGLTSSGGSEYIFYSAQNI